jgi:hypothetical protein
VCRGERGRGGRGRRKGEEEEEEEEEEESEGEQSRSSVDDDNDPLLLLLLYTSYAGVRACDRVVMRGVVAGDQARSCRRLQEAEGGVSRHVVGDVGDRSSLIFSC